MPDGQRGELVERTASLVDLIDRTLQTGVAIRGEVVLCIADIELVAIDLRAVLGSALVVRSRSAPDEQR